MIRTLMFVGAALALCACTTPDPTARDLDQISRDYQHESADSQNVDQATHADICGASHFQDLIGKPESQINRDALPLHTRIIRPGVMVTQDFLPERLNIRVGPDGKVASLQCF